MPQIEKEINSALFLLSGVHASYKYIELKSQNLEHILKNLDGFNVTTLYKQEIIKYLSNIAEDVELPQSVNTVKRLGKNLVGYNTNSHGFMQTLKMLNILPPKSFCIVGANATARAIAVELANWGANYVEIAVKNTNSQDLKTTLRLLKLSSHNLQIEVEKLSKLTGGVDMLINTEQIIPVSDVPESAIIGTKYVFKTEYNTKETELTKLANLRNIQVIMGIYMKVWQAVMARKIWYGAQFKEADIYRILQRYLLYK
ncbi:MAG: hypothetical protein ACI4PK_03815 [Oscillospiraceae bacterium]